MSRLLIVSNRLPVTVVTEDGRVEVTRSTGGLATGLAGPHGRGEGVWIGWPGDVQGLDAAGRAALEERLAANRTVPVWLEPDEITSFYEGVCNEVLWPLFHYLLDQLPLHVDWQVYERVNQRFADVVAAHHQPGDLVWVHDYHLMLVPRMLRERVPDARIGFFLHIPFPSSEVFRTLQSREYLLEGLLGADLVAFHTASYMRHFTSCLLRVLGIPSEVDRVHVGAREVRLGAFPMSVDVAKFGRLGEDSTVLELAKSVRGESECRILVGVDRLDYTKGIPRRLAAFEEMLRRDPSLSERVRLIQVAVPSRTNVEAYQDFRHQLEGMIGGINGTFGTPRWAPIHYIYRNLSEPELVALYRAADVMLVTPVRDGMNLVAKEFVASRSDGGGVLVLSEFAGAASELAEALQVNPYDVRTSAEIYARALTLPEEERQARMRALRRRLVAYDVHHWVRAFVDTLQEASDRRTARVPVPTAPDEVQAAIARIRQAPRLMLLLDYDGTLVPFAGVPELASPDEGLQRLLAGLATRAGTDVQLVSGRSRETIERWLGALPIGLHAEHGFWSRPAGATEWVARPEPPIEWRGGLLAILESFTARTPGSLIEERTASVAWHYRMADPEFGAFQANELKLHLTQLLSNAPVEILTRDRIIEVRPHGVNKGAIVAALVADLPKGSMVVAMGDDPSDEDLFAALPPDSLAIHVGRGPSRAGLRLAGVAEARRFLASLLDSEPPA